MIKNKAMITERKFDAFVKRVLRNRHFDYIKKKQRETDRLTVIPLESVEGYERTIKEEMFNSLSMLIDGVKVVFHDECLYLALESLDMTKKRIVIYFYIFGFSLSEISQMLNLKKETIKVYKSIALKELRKTYESFL
ncbi:MAG: hypothetical protein NC489_37190 [Ruminococcus flavefaciens]|nr:hypothetical protein [Ruminococcus flavefaciens]